MQSVLLAALIPILILPTACSTIGEKALMTHVVDGDTLEIQGRDRVRYIGIDTSERGEPYYLEATAKKGN